MPRGSVSRAVRRFSAMAVSLVLAAVVAPVGAFADTVTTELVAQGGPPSISPPHWVSDDGRYILFIGSPSGVLTLADTVSETETVIPGAGYTYATLSDDGRYVAYAGGEGSSPRTALWDRSTNTTEFVSLTDDDQPVETTGYGPTVSGDGRYLAFVSVDPAATPPGWDYGSMGPAVFLRDRVSGTTTSISSTPGGNATGSFMGPSLSDDGSVAVWTGALVPYTGVGGIVVWKRATNSLSEISANPECCSATDRGPMISGNGRFVVWSGGGPDEAHNLWIHDLQSSVTQPLSSTIGKGASISDDGRFVSYTDYPTDVGTANVFRLDRQTGTEVQLNIDPAGDAVDGSLRPVSVATARRSHSWRSRRRRPATSCSLRLPPAVT